MEPWRRMWGGGEREYRDMEDLIQSRQFCVRFDRRFGMKEPEKVDVATALALPPKLYPTVLKIRGTVDAQILVIYSASQPNGIANRTSKLLTFIYV
jgi:hypothetical protein